MLLIWTLASSRGASIITIPLGIERTYKSDQEIENMLIPSGYFGIAKESMPVAPSPEDGSMAPDCSWRNTELLFKRRNNLIIFDP